MKAKVSIPTRGKSNPPMKGLTPASVLEEETKKMEEKLNELKELMALEAAKREGGSKTGGVKWKSANDKLPIKNYAKSVLDTKPRNSLGTSLNKENAGGSAIKRQSSKDNLGLSNTQVNEQGIKGSAEKPPMNKSTSSSMLPKEEDIKNASNTSNTIIQKKKMLLPHAGPIKVPQPNKKGVGDSMNSNQDTDTTNTSETNNTKLGEVAQFLESMGLGKYLQTFKENGFDEMEIVLEMSTKHLVEMKIPAGHQIKIIKRIQKMNHEDPETMKQTLTSNTKFNSTSPALQEDGTLKNQSSSSRISSAIVSRRSNVEDAQNENVINEIKKQRRPSEIINPEDHWKQSDQDSTKSPKKVRFTEGESAEEQKMRKTGPILKGQGKPPTPQSKQKPQAQSATQVKEKKATSEIPIQTDDMGVGVGVDEGIGMDEKSIKKAGCWLCFKLVSEDDVVSYKTKQFCSEGCLNRYKENNTIECGTCHKKTIKDESILLYTDWFCSEKCCPSEEEHQKLLAEMAEQQYNELEENKEEESHTENEEEFEEREEDFEFDLGVGTNNEETMPLEDLVEKYKYLEKSETKANKDNIDDRLMTNDELEDSLN